MTCGIPIDVCRRYQPRQKAREPGQLPYATVTATEILECLGGRHGIPGFECIQLKSARLVQFCERREVNIERVAR